ncbi:hypothetical protein ACTDI4_04305 [Mesorhizobium sp. PUT5]|uniref:plasmid recombination protein n=1 Tax=Mesorhizobium sp. PUT5 TaxID=3454629 RepID=UPI003FA4CF8D
MSYQFVHMELYSRKGRDGRSVDFVLAEAARRPDACLHVQNPVPPAVVFGVDVDEVRHLHDERAATAKATLATGKQRAIRQDQNTLLTVVASHPAAMDSVASNPALADEVKEWEARTVAWLRDQYGVALVSVIRHVDESYPHLHAFVLPEAPDLRAGALHPGQEAKRRVVSAGAANGEDGKTLNRRADVAYREAMRDWQDSYWQAVGLPCGLTRLGPGRRRLTRDEWQAERTQVRAVRHAQDRAALIEAEADSLASQAKADAAIAHAERTEADRIRAAAVEQAAIAKRLHDAAEMRLRKARAALSRASDEGKRILGAAHREADRLRAFGGRLRALWDGLRRSAMEDRLRASVARDLARERTRADEAGRRVAEEARRRREAESRAEDAVASARAVGRERDAARRQLSALLPDLRSEKQLTLGRTRP